MSTDRDQSRLIAERVARRVAGSSTEAPAKTSQASSQNGTPIGDELSAIRLGLHDLERKLDRLESKMVPSATQSAEPARARMIDFVSTESPAAPRRTVGDSGLSHLTDAKSEFKPVTQSPWLAPLSQMSQPSRDPNSQSVFRYPQSASHPSEERFGIEEAAVSELVEFFENEKKCSVDPSGKPCDHCAMCSSRGF